MQLGSSKQFFGEAAITFPPFQLNVLGQYSLFYFSRFILVGASLPVYLLIQLIIVKFFSLEFDCCVISM